MTTDQCYQLLQPGTVVSDETECISYERESFSQYANADNENEQV